MDVDLFKGEKDVEATEVTESEFTNYQQTLNVLGSFIIIPILVILSQGGKWKKIGNYLLFVWFLLEGMGMGILFFFAKHEWIYSMRLWLGKVFSFSWRYDWYCAVGFMLNTSVAFWFLWLNHRKNDKKSCGVAKLMSTP